MCNTLVNALKWKLIVAGEKNNGKASIFYVDGLDSYSTDKLEVDDALSLPPLSINAKGI